MNVEHTDGDKSEVVFNALQNSFIDWFFHRYSVLFLIIDVKVAAC